MSQVASPYGLRPVKMLGDRPWSHGVHAYPMTVNQTKGLFFGDPVGLIGGSPAPLTATPVAGTLSANSPIGVFMGCYYTDPIRGFVNAQYLPANAVNNGLTKIGCMIADDPDLVMQVQADGVVTVDKTGMNAALGNFSAGSLFTGDSGVNLASAGVGATATLALRIYDFVYNATPSPGAGSNPGDPFTDCLVVWNFGVHRFTLGGGQ